MLSDEKLFKNPDVSNNGVFVLMKAVYLGDDVEHSSMDYRCDAAAYFPMTVSAGTSYEDGQPALGKEIKPENIKTFETVLDMTPHLYIVYLEFHQKVGDIYVDAKWLEGPEHNSHMRMGKSLVQLLRNMREWAYVADACDEQHPFALYSKKFYELANPPQHVIDEIDALPQMHLSKFFNGQEDYRQQPENYPNLSDSAKEWFRGLQSNYQYRSPAEQIADLELPDSQ